ncbi:hypothetical protein [Streptomyces sp. NPDC020965]|uniref:hypothetical protein n=1 Tax=Streptomyces sp. NPDC020965 TaxID=3365105 RepID=UPI0037B7D0A7
MPERPGTRLVGTACASALLATVLTAPTAAARAVEVRTAPVAATACPSSVATYALEHNRITRYVDWDPKNTEYGHLFSAEKSTSFPILTRLFPGGGSRLFAVDPRTGNPSLKSYQDRTESGGDLLSPEYTFAERAGQNWTEYRGLWSDADGRLVQLDAEGSLHVYVIQLPDGTPASARMSRLALLPASNPALKELSKSTAIWAAGDTIYGRLDGTIRSWNYQAALNSVTLGPKDSGTVVGTGFTDAKDLWSPGPGVVNTADSAGTVRKYAGTPLRLVDADIAAGVPRAFANPAPCLSSAPENEKPYFGVKPVESTDPPLEPPTPDPPVPSGPAKVSGKFTLGDGTPAAGLDVTVEALIPAKVEGEEFDLPDLGKARTRADGTWTLTLPETLPPAAQTAMDDNGGSLNVTASTTAVSTSGARLFGVDHRTAAPPDPVTGTVSRAAATQSAEAPHSIELLPLLDEDAPELNLPEPTASQRNSTYGAALEREAVYRDEPTPRWQSDRGPVDNDYNPYLINGRDISSERVSAYASGSCSWVSLLKGRTYSYTTVGEAHAYNDAKASFEYENKVQNTIDIAVNSSGTWKIGGAASIGTSSSAISGYQPQGPFFAKQWRIPMEYHKIRRIYICGAQQRSSYEEVIPIRYTIPKGWMAGNYGKDVRHLDGATRYRKSNPNYRTVLANMSVQGITRGKSVKWSGAATPFGLSLGGSLTYDSNHTQKIFPQNKKIKHNVWGLYDRISGKPGVIYSY